MPRIPTPTLSSIRKTDSFVGEITVPISFPVHYALRVDINEELLILCHLDQREFPFALWTKKTGLSAVAFEPFHSLATNGCLSPITEFCEQAYDAWCAGNKAGTADCDDRNRECPPTDGKTDEA
jgi:hypothetical protein